VTGTSPDVGWSDDPVVRRVADDLRSTDVFRALNVSEAQHMATLCARRLLGPGDTLFQEGEVAAHLYIVLRGHLRVLVYSPDRTAEVVVGEVGPHSLLGEMAVLEQVPRSATAVATEPAELLELPGEVFSQLVKDGHLAAFAILRHMQHTLADRLRNLDVRVDAVFDDPEAEGSVPEPAPQGSGPEPTLWHLIDEQQS
jgi:CRP-like cAMP-binding protein